MEPLKVRRFSARRHDIQRQIKDFLRRHLLRHLPPPPSTPSIRTRLVSCLMVTRGNVVLVRQSLAAFNDQSWPERELIIVTVNVTDELEDLIRTEGQGRVTLVPAQEGLSLGEQRNLTLAHTHGEYVCIWDDDDLYSPERIAISLGALQQAGVDAVFLDRVLLWWPNRNRLAISFSRLWENTMLAKRTAVPAYLALAKGEDSVLVDWLTLHSSHAMIDCPSLYGYRVTGNNITNDYHFDRLFGLSNELSGNRKQRLLQSPCFRYAASTPIGAPFSSPAVGAAGQDPP